MFKKLKDRIRYISLLKKKILLLERENESLKDTVVESVDLVADFRRAAGEMNKFINQMYKEQIQQLHKDHNQSIVDQFNEFEEEDVEEYVENITKKKMTIH